MDIQYRFKKGSEILFDLSLPFEEDFTLHLPLDSPAPAWAALEHHQCSNCPLDPAIHPHCPVARNLYGVVSRFQDNASIDQVVVQVRVRDRVVMKQGSLQQGLAAVIGLMMATSGCPILDHFRPMAYTHLPFAGEEETLFRFMSIYLLAQLVRAQSGQEADWSLEHMGQIFEAVQRVNQAFANRLRDLEHKDASVNGLIILDIFAQMGSLTPVEEWHDEHRMLFTAFLDT